MLVRPPVRSRTLRAVRAAREPVWHTSAPAKPSLVQTAGAKDAAIRFREAESATPRLRALRGRCRACRNAGVYLLPQGLIASLSLL